MADNTKIEWADATLNYVNGCTRKSPGCMNCYAELLAATRLRNVPSRAGLAEMTPGGPRWTGKINIDDRALDQAMRWRRPRRIFWNAHGDLFHEAVPDEAIDRLFAVCALTPHHTHMILTKRSARMREYFSGDQLDARIDCDMDQIIRERVDPLNRRSNDLRAVAQCVNYEDGEPLPNVWLGVSVEDQQRADERIPDLLETPAAVRFLSAEPLLGPLDLMHVDYGAYLNGLTGRKPHEFDPQMRWPLLMPFQHMQSGATFPGIDWVIAGGESGPGARPMHPDWACSLRDQCARAGVPFFFKQWGEWAATGPHNANMLIGSDASVRHPRLETAWLPNEKSQGRTLVTKVGKKAAGRLLDGVEHNEFPEVRS